jgi:hypothetical protein
MVSRGPPLGGMILAHPVGTVAQNTAIKSKNKPVKKEAFRMQDKHKLIQVEEAVRLC